MIEIDATNVSNYFFEEAPKEFWRMDDPEFYNCNPPFEMQSVLVKAPRYISSSEEGMTPWVSIDGWSFVVNKVPIEQANQIEKFRNLVPDKVDYMLGAAFFASDKLIPTGIVLYMFILDGNIIPGKNGGHVGLVGDADKIKKFGQELLDHCSIMLQPILLTFSYLNRKKVTLEQIEKDRYKVTSLIFDGQSRNE